MKLLLLDPGLAMSALNWKTRFDSAAAIDLTSAWYRAFDEKRDLLAFTASQIEEYLTKLAMDH
ncbi:MAG: hypothetical protein EOP84_08675 [Verrucomicrobiaceae bacterium]|nr:MAG: hypothetical protein EOP84_08675 [Verrucomicrobiaceae bacterium]